MLPALVLLVLFPAVLVAANGNCDEKPPQLDYLDVTFEESDRHLNIRFRGLDNFTGLASVGFRWTQTTGDASVWCGHNLPLDHNPSDTVVFRCRVPDSTQNAFSLLAASVIDRVGNALVYGEKAGDAGFDEPNVPLGRRPASFGGGNYNFTATAIMPREAHVVKYAVATTTFDITNATVELWVEVEIDTPANFSSALILWDAGRDLDSASAAVTFTPADLINGTATRGFYGKNHTFYRSGPNATYTLSMLQVYDSRGNQRWYGRGVVPGPEVLVVTSQSPDRVPPAIWRFELNPGVVNSTLGASVITATIGLSDDQSGIWAFQARFCRASASNIRLPVSCWNGATIIPVRNSRVEVDETAAPRTGDRLNGTWSVEIPIPKSTPTGLYGLSLDGLWVWDRAGNRQNLRNDAALRRRFSNGNQFAVVCGSDRVPVNPPSPDRDYTIWIIVGSVVGFLLFVFLARIICCGGGNSNSLNEDRHQRLLS